MAIGDTLPTGLIETLKKVYSDDKVRARVELKHPFMKSLRKMAIKGEGQNYTFAVGLNWGAGQGNSMTEVLAGTAGDPNAAAEMANFVVNTGDDACVVNLARKFLERAKEKGSGFAPQFKYQTDKQLEGLGLVMAKKISGDGTGSICRVNSTAAGSITNVQLTTVSHSKYFAKGMKIALAKDSNDDGTGKATTTVSNPLTIASVNPSTGLITLTGSTATGGAGNYFHVGQYGIVGKTTGAAGLRAWIPLTAPSGTTIGNSLISCSHDRSVDPLRLAGFRYNDTARPIDESIYLLAQQMHERGASPDVCLVSFNTYNKIAVKQWARIVPTGQAEAKQLGLMPLGIMTGAGVIPFQCDSSIEDDRGYLLNKSTWALAHIGDGVPFRVKDASGQDGLFDAAGAVQVRWEAWWNLICIDPYENGVFAVDSTQF